MHKRKVLAGIGISVAAALTLGGCSSSAGDDGGTVTLQMVESLTNPVRTELLDELIGEFEEKNPTIKVELISPPTEQADQKIQQMLQAGSGVDVLEVRDLTVGPFSTNGWLDDMTEEFDGWDGWDQLTPNAKAVAEGDGEMYYVPYGFYGLSLFYRTDMVEAAGFDAPPSNWEELLEQATAIQGSGDNQFGYAFRGGKNGFTNAVTAISAYVADQIDTKNAYKLENGDSIFSAPEASDALDVYFELFEKASPPSSVAWGYPEMVEGFTNGSTGFLLQDPEVIASVQESTAVTDEQWNTAPTLAGPSGKAFQALATAGWGIAEKSEHKEEAAKLIQFLSSGDASIRFTEGNSLVPIIQGADESEFYKIGPWESYLYMSEHPEDFVTGEQPRGVAWWTEWSEKADTELQQVLIGQMTQDDLLASWDAYWTEKWANE
ncbi:ABC transporter substrate-binding protein [Mycetocola zhadangensis]|jgi:multiple sugar transport system substrate-binding protein|uniref:ABC transporter substrate-binding protein n=1 Tax=Mycetocola zhadangensis TaxID=1164595 RepID=UPI003A4DEBED